MTSYSISSEIPPQRLANQPSTEPPKPAEYSDWESKIARLVGFEDESKTVNVEATEEPDIPEGLTADPQELKAKQPLSTNPFAKLTLVASATLVVVMLAGVFLSQLMGGSGQKANNVATITTPPTAAPRERNLEQEIETLKTKLALAEQAQALTAAQQNLRTGDTLSRLDGRTNSRNNVATRTQAVPTPAPTVYLPQPIGAGDRIAARPVPPTVVLPPVTPVSPAPQTITQPSVTTPPPPPDPLQEWARLAKLGSYGMVSLTGTSAVNISQAPTTPNNPNDNVVAPELSQPQPNPEAQAQGTRSVPVGTSVKAVVATAIFGETTRSRNNDRDEEDKNTFVIQLKEPLKSADGEVVIPAKTELLAEIKSLSEQGLVQLNVNKIVTVDKGNVIQKALPNNAITIRGVRGRPLIANKFPNSSGTITSMDLGLFVLGGIGKAAELYNRTDGQVVTINGGSTIVSNNNPQRNIIAGVFEGGFNSVIPQISQRNQQAIAQLSQQTNVWLIPAGKEVEIYVNQLLQF
jgi:hypothetical protein